MKIGNVLTVFQNKIMDKMAHYGVGAFVSSLIYLFFPSFFGIIFTLVCVVSIGVIKEAVDLKVRKTYFSYLDLIFTVSGTFLPTIFVLLLLVKGLK